MHRFSFSQGFPNWVLVAKDSISCIRESHAFIFAAGLIELVSSNRYNLACVHIDDSDQFVHLHSLIGVFIWCSIGSQGFFKWKTLTDQTVQMHTLI